MAQAAAIIRQQQTALHLAHAAIGWADSIRRRGRTLGAAAFPKDTKAFMLAAAAAALACVCYQNSGRERAAVEPLRGETIVFRQEVQTDNQLEAMQASGDQEDEGDAPPLTYARTVQTVRFFNPAPVQTSTTGPHPTLPRRKSGLPDLRTMLPNPGEPGLGREGVRKGEDGKVATNNAPRSVSAGPTYRGEGIASWYGSDFHGHKTANGERYDMNGISAAHRTMPLPSYARVTNLDNGRSIIVRVNNRGPYVHHRIVDLSTGAAKALDFYKKGTTHVRVEFVGRASPGGSDDRMLLATLRTGTPAPVPDEVIVASAKALPGKDSDEKPSRSKGEH
jgi:rare lipoprotein A (peptidoglycan hydrolase)